MDDQAAFEKHCKWYEKNLKIRSKQAQIVPLKLNRIQRDLEYYKWKCFQQDIPCYAIVLKARQEGVSTWAEATLFRDSREMKHRESLVMAHKEDASRKIFQMTQRFYDHLPKKPETVKSSARTIKFKDTESEIQVETAGAGSGAGRSWTAQGLHLSELDFYNDPEEVLGGLLQTLPDRGKMALIIESTANGPMLTMNELWDRAVDGRNEFQPFFFPWFYDEEYTRPITVNSLRKYGPRAWIKKHEQWLNKVEKEIADGLVEPSKHAPRGGGGGEAAVGNDVSSPGREDQGSTGDEETQEGDRAPRPKDERARSGPWRRLSPDQKRRKLRRGDDGSAADSGNGELSEAGADGEGRDWEDFHPGISGIDPDSDPRFGGTIESRTFSLESVFRDSLTDYEIGLIQEFEVTLEQINWLRFCLETKCQGDETRRRREYPSRPEEAFEASGADILDPAILSEWTREAQDAVQAKGSMIAREVSFDQIVVAFDDTDRGGKIEIYEYPDPHHRYVMGIDPSQGIEGGDWTVAFVMDVDTGNQVAEFRATIDPDLAIDQIEWLGIYYNEAFTIIEVNAGYGAPYVRHLVDRNTLPIYEQIRLDRTVRQYMKKPGWDTTTRTRPQIIAETKSSVRNERCKIRSMETLKECRTLYENPTGKIEARPNHHDDGFFAYGLCLMARNHLLGIDTVREEQERKENDFLRKLNKRARDLDIQKKRKIACRNVAKISHVRGHTLRPDGRRSVA